MYNLNSRCTAGGFSNSGYRDEVLLYNSEEDEWTTVGRLSIARHYHAMSLVPKETADFCVQSFEKTYKPSVNYTSTMEGMGNWTMEMMDY